MSQEKFTKSERLQQTMEEESKFPNFRDALEQKKQDDM
jgi:hypothetical protein